MPKKVKKSIKNNKNVPKKISFLKRYTLPILAVSALVLGFLLYKSMLVSPDINMVVSEGGGKNAKITNSNGPTGSTCSAAEKSKGCKMETRTINKRRVKDCFCPKVVVPTCPKGQEWSQTANKCVSSMSIEAPLCEDGFVWNADSQSCTKTPYSVRCCKVEEQSGSCQLVDGKRGDLYFYMKSVTPQGSCGEYIKCPQVMNNNNIKCINSKG